MNAATRLHAARLWRAYPREILALSMLGISASVALAGSAWSTPTFEGVQSALASGEAAPPAPPPLLVRQLAPVDAVAVNAAIPIASGANPAARPFSLGKASATARAQALDCLTSAIYYEAANESTEGQQAVAQVVLNRVRHPAFPKSICGVVYEGSTRATGCQFTFTCDGSLGRGAVPALWTRARRVAEAALAGAVYAPVGNATHYHANYVVPYWASSLSKSAVVGTHIFYRWSGGWGRPQAFSQAYAQREPDARALRVAATQARLAHAAAASDPDVQSENELEALAAASETKTNGGRRIGVRFAMKAREAVEAVEHKPYVEKVSASDNLRWTLSGGAPDASAKPLGRSEPAAEAGAAASSGASPE